MEADQDLRKLWKTRPWIGMGVALLMAYLLVRSLLQGKVKFENRKYGSPEYVTWADEPIHFSIIIGLLLVFLAGALAYCVFRFRRRSKYIQEDAK